MSSFSFGIVKIDDKIVVMDGFSAMYVRAQQAGDTKLIEILEHRSKVHGGGPCHCPSEA